MNRIVIGALGALLLVTVGLFWWQGRAEVERAAPPPLSVTPSQNATEIPSATIEGLIGPDLPESTPLTREQKRFGRYDRDSDGRITRNEMLSTRTAAFRKLDKDGNNLLTFEEWAVATVEKFDMADRNHDLWLSPDEFRTTAPPDPRATPKCSCR